MRDRELRAPRRPPGADEGPPSPSLWRAVRLLIGLSLRRRINRLASFTARRSKPGAARLATPRKPAAGRWFLAVLGVLFLLQSTLGTTQLVRRLAQAAEHRDYPDLALVEASTLETVQSAAAETEHNGGLRRETERELDSAFDVETFMLRDDEQRLERKRELFDLFERRGAAAFRETRLPRTLLLPDAALWYRGADPLAMSRSLAVVALLVGLAVVLQHVAGADRDLADADAGLEWQCSFPVPARALFFGRALEAAATGPLTWVFVFPFYSVIFWCAGFGGLGLLLGALAAAYLGVLAGVVRILLEALLRRFFSTPAVARVQAALLLAGYVLMVASFGVAYSPNLSWLSNAAERFPTAISWNPLSLAIGWTARGSSALGAGLYALCFCVAFLSAGVEIADRSVRRGITQGTREHSGARDGASPLELTAGRLTGVALKELRAILRNRQLRTQVLVTPTVLVAFQAWLNPSLLAGIGAEARHVAAAAFIVGAMSLATGASSALALEGPALWLLYTAPVPLEELLQQKARVWTGVAQLFASAVLLVFWLRQPALFLPTLPYAAFVFAGLYLYSFVALGIGALGTDALEAEPRKRIRLGSVYLFMVLSALFAYSLYTPSLWAKCVQLVLSALLAHALWQKLRDQLPYLLDPTEAPPANISIADGILAALAFFTLQGVAMVALSITRLAPGPSLLLAFASAGLCVMLLSVFLLYRSGVPALPRALGLSLPSGTRWVFAVRALLQGFGVGVAAAVVARAYLEIVAHVPWLDRIAHEALRFSGREASGRGRIWFALLAVLAAPIFEEFIFRGVLYTGLRRSLRPLGAALASATVFGLVHPAIAALPVFVMAFGAALVYERTRWLPASMATHVAYNAILVGAALFAR